MAFVNKKISKDERIKYGLDAIDSSVPRGIWHPSGDWTIDCDRNIYLRQLRQSNIGSEAEQKPKFIERIYHFYLNGKLYKINFVENLLREITIEEKKVREAFWVIESIYPNIALNEKTATIKLLYEALKERKGGGIYSEWILDYQLTLIVDGQEMCHV